MLLPPLLAKKSPLIFEKDEEMNVQQMIKQAALSALLLFLVVGCSRTENSEGTPQVDDDETVVIVEPTVTVDISEEVEEPDGLETMIDIMAEDIEGTSWTLSSIDGVDVDEELTLDISEGTLSGYDGCNQFGGTYTVVDGALNIGDDFVVTEQLCPDEEVMALGRQYINSLTSAAALAIDDDTLTVETDSGELIFVPAVDAELLNTQWRLSGLGDGDAIVTTGLDENIFFVLDGETISGSGGCNAFGGTLVIEGESISVGDIESTQEACEDEEVNQRELAFFTMLDNVTRYEVSRDTLNLYDAQDALLASLTVADDADVVIEDDEVVEEETAVQVDPTLLDDIIWSLVYIVVGGDALVPVPDNANPNLIFADGAVSGNAGCNQFNGPVVIEDESIDFGALALTQVACDAELTALETAVVDLLENAATYSVEDGTLELFNADGLPLALFSAAEQLTLFVGPELVDCVGVAPQQCFQVREDIELDYELLYEPIAGFEFEPGFEYEIVVNVTEVIDPPADASTLAYKLVEIVDQQPVEVEVVEEVEEEVAVAVEDLIDIEWRWVRFEDTAGLNDITVADPSLYTLTFMEDGTYAIQLDCNTGTGSYTVENGSITIQPATTTLAACGKDSLANDFILLLEDVVTFVFDDNGNLVLNLRLDGGNVVFTSADG